MALVAGVVVLAIYFIFFREEDTVSTVPVNTSTPAEEPQFVKEGELAFLDATAQDTLRKINIEVADNDEERTQGLMYRTKMEDSQGYVIYLPTIGAPLLLDEKHQNAAGHYLFG